MDPLANVREQREIAQRLIERAEAQTYDHRAVFLDATRLAELVQALDTWRTCGGFDPYPALRREGVT